MDDKEKHPLPGENWIPRSIVPDARQINHVLKRERKRKKNTVSVKAIRAVQYMNEGMSVAGSLRKAGYAEWTAKLGTNYLKQKPGVFLKAAESLGNQLQSVGLTNMKIASKIAEFVDAKKIDHSHTEPDKEVPDYKTQVEGVKLWQGIMEPKAVQGKKTREISFTEWVSE